MERMPRTAAVILVACALAACRAGPAQHGCISVATVACVPKLASSDSALGLDGFSAAVADGYMSTPVPYVGSELVHPDVLHVPSGWSGYEYWMAVTPYPGSDAATTGLSADVRVQAERTWLQLHVNAYSGAEVTLRLGFDLP